MRPAFSQKVALHYPADVNTVIWRLRNQGLRGWGTNITDGEVWFAASDTFDLLAEIDAALGPGRAEPRPIAVGGELSA